MNLPLQKLIGLLLIDQEACNDRRCSSSRRSVITLDQAPVNLKDSTLHDSRDLVGLSEIYPC